MVFGAAVWLKGHRKSFCFNEGGQKRVESIGVSTNCPFVASVVGVERWAYLHSDHAEKKDNLGDLRKLLTTRARTHIYKYVDIYIIAYIYNCIYIYIDTYYIHTYIYICIRICVCGCFAPANKLKKRAAIGQLAW